MRRPLLIVLFLLVIGAAGFFAYAWKGAIDPISPPARTAFDPKLIEKGATLAAVGNCTACHTRPGGKTFAGAFPLPTPFGTIYSSNITPDPDTGIGRWSEAAFIRAMRQGVRRDGAHLYPAFPYDHYTLVSDEDNRALYAFLMTRPAVKETRPANELPFPLNQRIVLAGWQLLFLKQGPYQQNASQSPEWNRGAYLVTGLGHCGGCHTPRNALGAEKSSPLAGGEAEGWAGYALNASSPSPVPWTGDSLNAYLRNGWHAEHGVASGPMAEVTGNLAPLPDSDIAAIATYVVAVMGTPSADRVKRGEDVKAQAARSAEAALQTVAASTGNDPGDRGRALYVAACATCHDGSRPLPFGGISLHLSSTIAAPDAQNAVNMVLFGLPAASGRQSAIMPGFADTMTDQQVADLLGYLRKTFSNQPAWSDVATRIADTRSGKFKVSVRPSDGIERAPDNIGAR